MATFTWFKKMLSFPNQMKLTTAVLFTQWSSLLAYGGGGLLLLCAPSLWGMLLVFDVDQRALGYLRLAGVHLMALSFIYITVARSGSCALKHGPTLSSILERLVLVNGILLLFILRNTLPLYFALVFILLDTALALLTLCLWIRETPLASFMVYINEVANSFQRIFPVNKSTMSCFSVQSIGILQFCGGLVVVVFPWLIQDSCNLQPFENYAEGFISCSFLLLTVHGWFHVMAGGATLAPFPTATVFYRLSFTLPSQCILFLCDQIELRLFILLESCEFAFAVIILFSILLENGQRKRKIQDLAMKQEIQEKRNSENITIADIEDMNNFVIPYDR